MTTETDKTPNQKSLEDYISMARLYMINNSSDQLYNDIWATEMGGLNPTTHSRWDPSQFNLEKARAFADNSSYKGGGGGNAAIRRALGLRATGETTGLDDHDLWELYQQGFGSIPKGIKNPYTKSVEEATEGTTDASTDTSTDTTTTTPNYLTQNDLTTWWEGIDKSGWAGNTEDSQPKGMDDFMKFMMFMSMMRPQTSRSGSQYGYGGLNPGGVASTYNPMDNISQLVTAFGQLPGSSSIT